MGAAATDTGPEPTYAEAVEIRELGHIVLYVRDLQRSARFYRDVLGWRQILDGGTTGLPFPAAAFSGSADRTHHELLLIEVGEDAAPIPHGRRVGMYHVGFRIGDTDDDLREAVQVLESHGVPIVGATDHTVTHSLYILDPDGNEIELYIDVPGVNWRDDRHLLAAPLRPLRL